MLVLTIIGCSDSQERADPVEEAQERIDSLRLIHAETYEAIIMLNISIDQEVDSIRSAHSQFLPLDGLDSIVVMALGTDKSMLDALQPFFDPSGYDRNMIVGMLDSMVTKTSSARIKLRADLQFLRASLSQQVESINNNLFLSFLDAEGRTYTKEPYIRLLAKYNQFHDMYERQLVSSIDSLSHQGD